MASSITLFNKLTEYLAKGIINLETDTIKLALLTSSWTADATLDIFGDITASPSPEASGSGYTQGGSALTSQTVTLTDSPAKTVFDAADLTFTALTATFRYGILYANKSTGSPAIVDPLIAYILFDTSPADIVVSGVDWKVQWNAAGIFDISKA
ncbi:MAG: hypothetical protein ABFD75_12480 [Smithella sp.]